jgi:hypothetical protein
MAHFAGLDPSAAETPVCIVDDTGRVILDQLGREQPADTLSSNLARVASSYNGSARRSAGGTAARRLGT